MTIIQQLNFLILASLASEQARLNKTVAAKPFECPELKEVVFAAAYEVHFT